MAITPNEQIFWSDIKAACLSAIKSKCCNIDTFMAGLDEAYIYGNNVAYTGYADATTTMPYHDVTVTFTNNDEICQLVTSEIVEEQLENYLSTTLGANYVSKVSTYRSILNLYDVIAAFISGRLLLVSHPFKNNAGYVFYNSSESVVYPTPRISTNMNMSVTDMTENLNSVMNSSCYIGHEHTISLTMSNECVTTGYPSGYAAYESSAPGTYTFNVAQSGVYDVHIVGGGGGGSEGASDISGAWYIFAGAGGSGAHVWWWQYLDAGSYSVTVGDKGARVSGGYGSRTGGTGGNTIFLSQTAGGGLGGTSHGGAGGGSSSGGEGGSYTTSYNGTAGNKGNSGIWSQTGGASVYTGYGKGGDSSTDNAGTGAIVLFYKSALAPAVFESSTPGTHTVNITETSSYEIVVVGAGGGGGAQGDKYTWKSSSAGGGSGAYAKIRTTLTAGSSYSLVIGAGGAGHGGGWTQVGDAGGASSFGTLVSCTGGGGGYAAFTDGTPGVAGGAGGTYTVDSTVTTVAASNGNVGGTTTNIVSNEAPGGASVYGGYGAGGSARATGHNAGYGNTGGNGYICVRKLAGK